MRRDPDTHPVPDVEAKRQLANRKVQGVVLVGFDPGPCLFITSLAVLGQLYPALLEPELRLFFPVLGELVGSRIAFTT